MMETNKLRNLVTFFIQFISVIVFFSIIFELMHRIFSLNFFIFNDSFFLSFIFVSIVIIFHVQILSIDDLIYLFVCFIFLLFIYIFLIIRRYYYLHFLYGLPFFIIFRVDSFLVLSLLLVYVLLIS
jgi:hypothetical protein